jgi:hypothetical protein
MGVTWWIETRQTWLDVAAHRVTLGAPSYGIGGRCGVVSETG